MSEKVECYIVRDLLPNYIEHLTNEQTSKTVEKHLNGCSECREVYKNMNQDVSLENAEELNEVKDAFHKTRKMYLLKGLLIACAAIPIFVCFIVNLAVDHYLSWFHIVTGGIILTAAIVTPLIFKKKNRYVTALAGLTVLIFPYLWIIEVISNKYLTEVPFDWFYPYALLYCLIWIGILWAGYILYKIVKLNILLCTGICSGLAVIGSTLTNWIANNFKDWDDALINSIIGNLILGGIAVICILMGLGKNIFGKHKN